MTAARSAGVQRSRRLLPVFPGVSRIALLLGSGILFCLSATFLPLPYAHADDSSWQAFIATYPSMPSRLVAVDKRRQQLFIFNPGASPELASTYICTTGQNTGDKQVEGDLKTPEGVYFVVQHLRSGLDYTLYGKEAYTLNYPNPIDRLRRKTGYGIWIHGRGEALYPLQTQGCVAMNNSDLTIIGRLLTPGTPVILSNSLRHEAVPDRSDVDTVRLLEKRVRSWANAWGGRSREMFDFYDAAAYSMAQGEDFSRFRGQKERLFKMLPWIKTSVRDIQVLRGPGYWVTWFHQEYSAPNLSTEGVRRLYWAPDASGEFRILGMEWIPGMSTGTLVASAEPAMPPVDAAPRSEEQARPLAQAISTRDTSVLPVPRQSPPNPAHASLDLPPPLPAQGLASAQDSDTPPVAATPDGIRPGTDRQALPVAASEEDPAKAAEKAKAAWEQAALEATEKKAKAGMEQPLKKPSEKARATEEAVEKSEPARKTAEEEKAAKKRDEDAARQQSLKAAADFVEAWRKAWQSGNLSAYVQCYAATAEQGDRKGAPAIRSQKKELWTRLAPASVILSNVRITLKGANRARAEMIQTYADKKGNKDKGKKILTLIRDNNRWSILREDWSPLAR